MTRKNSYDTIVLGLGAMGSAAVYQLAKLGNHVLGIDQFSPPHSFGSTHGDTRIIRQAIGEGEYYTPLVLRAYELWREIERETNKNLLTVTGGLIVSKSTESGFTHAKDSFFRNTLAAAKKYHIRHDILAASQIRERFPQFTIYDDEVGYYEYNAGFLRPEECVNAQLFLAQKYSAGIHTDEKVENFSENNGVVRVATNRDKYETGQLIISAGPWLLDLLGEKYSKLFRVIRQVMFWFDVKTSIERFLPERFPIFLWDGEPAMYGFPAVDGPHGGIKIAREQYETITTADTVNRNVSDEEIHAMYETCVAPRLQGIDSKCIKSATCLYTVTPDSGFIIDRHPEYPAVIIASPCSGHGFKHSAAIGEVLVELATKGKSSMDISKFKISRLS